MTTTFDDLKYEDKVESEVFTLPYTHADNPAVLQLWTMMIKAAREIPDLNVRDDGIQASNTPDVVKKDQ